MAKRDKGVGPYAGNDVKIRPDPRIDNSGNSKENGGVRGREISNIDEASNDPTVTDAKF
jgi:hypothetical protein